MFQKSIQHYDEKEHIIIILVYGLKDLKGNSVKTETTRTYWVQIQK